MADKPERHGIAKVLTIDFDALPLLLEMAPQKSQGRLLSELLRAEKASSKKGRRYGKSLTGIGLRTKQKRVSAQTPLVYLPFVSTPPAIDERHL